MSRIEHSRFARRRRLTIWMGTSVAVILLIVANIAHAGCKETGTNSPEPVCLNPPVGPTTNVIIGNSGTGTLTIDGSSTFSAGSLDAAAGGTGNGTITIDGSGTKVTLNPVGQSDVLDSGNWGIGSVTISGGAVVDGTNTASCAPGWCLSKVTNGAGSTGTLNITGMGSMLSVPNLLIVGFDVVNQPNPPSVFGTPGGASGGTLNVKAGGTLNTQDATIGLQATNSVPPALGTETASGTAVVDGAGSTWNVTTAADNAGLGIGMGKNSMGSLSITNGGAVSVALALEVGRNGGNGSLTVNGAGSAVSISGASTAVPAFLAVGAVDTHALAPSLGPSTIGNVTVQNGGKITIDLDNNVNGGILAGKNGGTGNITVTGAGSQIMVAGNNSNSTIAAGVAIGQSGSSTLNVLAGGKLVINDTGTVGQAGMAIGGSPTQVANGDQPGTGTVNISGAGSQLNVQSPHGFIFSGYSGTGTLNVVNGGAAAAEGLTVGVNTGSVGTLSLNGTGSSITLSGNDIGGGTGARLQVGASGTGSMSISSGAQLLINPMTANGGVYIGGTGTLPGGVGEMTVSGGSKVLVSGTGNNLIVGRNGTGSLTITGGSTVDVAKGAGSTGQTFVGAIPASFTSTAPLAGILALKGGSVLNAGSLLGIASNGVASSSGSGAVLLSGGSTINATNTVIGTNGLLAVADPAGTINGNVTNNGGTVSPGAPPGSLQINGNFTQTGGNIDLEIDSDGHGGFVTDKLVLENGADFGTTDATISFHFLDDANPNAFAADGLFNLDTFFRFANTDGTDETPLSSGIPGMLDTVFVDDTYIATADSFNITSFGFDPNTGVTELVATPTPEPASAGLLTTALIGFFGLGYARRRQYRLS